MEAGFEIAGHSVSGQSVINLAVSGRVTGSACHSRSKFDPVFYFAITDLSYSTAFSDYRLLFTAAAYTTENIFL